MWFRNRPVAEFFNQVQFLQQLINGVSLGAIYALIALGYTMIYGVLRFINFAHGDVFMVGSYVGYFAATQWVPSFFPGRKLGIDGPCVSDFDDSLRRIRRNDRIPGVPSAPRRPKLTVLITAIGVSLFLEYAGQLLFRPDPRGVSRQSFRIMRSSTRSRITIDTVEVVVIGLSLVLMFLLRIIVMRTKIGNRNAGG